MKSWFDWFPNGSIGYYKETTKTFYIQQEDIEAEVLFCPLEDANDVRNLLSLELTGACIAEFREMDSEVFEALDGRLGRYPRKIDGGPSWVGVWGDSNAPEEDSYWYAMMEGLDPKDQRVKKPNSIEVFKQPPAVVRRVDGGYDIHPLAENLPNLPADYYHALVRDKTDDFIRVNALVEYGRSHGGLPVHTRFRKETHVSRSSLRPNKDLLLLVSADFGLTPAMVLKQQDAFGRVLTLDEVVTFGMGIERAIETRLLPLLRSKYDGFEMFVTGDPSGATGAQSDEVSCADIFRKYRSKGLGKVKFAYSNNPVHRQGATDHFLSLLDDNGLPCYQIDPSCVWLIQALGGKYMWKKHRDGRHMENIEKNDWSHIAEASQYADMYFERGGRRKAEHREDSWLDAMQRQQRSGNIYATAR